MDAKDLIKILTFIAKASGVRSSSIFFRWSVFAYPFWRDRGNSQVGFKVMYYRGVDSSRTRATKMLLNHALTIVTSAIGSGTSGLAELGDTITGLGNYGGLRDAFGVDIGAVQLAEVLESSSASPEQTASAIISSGKLLKYAIVRIDKAASGGLRLHFRADNRPNSYTEWGVTNIHQLESSSTQFMVYPNGLITRGASPVGNWKTGRTA